VESRTYVGPNNIDVDWTGSSERPLGMEELIEACLLEVGGCLVTLNRYPFSNIYACRHPWLSESPYIDIGDLNLSSLEVENKKRKKTIRR